MSEMIRRGIGLLGGTFDPPHMGHLALASAALSALPLARVNLLPAGHPWQKVGTITSAEHRLAMLKAAVDTLNRDDIGIDAREMLHDGPTYTIDTLEALRERVGPAMPLVLIMGEDQWRNLLTWHRWEALLEKCHIAVANRETSLQLPKALEILLKCHQATPQAICQSAAGAIVHFRMPAHRATSTGIRLAFSTLPLNEALRRQGDALPTEVLTYIREHRLYGTAP